MGCGASKAVQVQPVTQTPRPPSAEVAKKPASAGKRSLNNKVGVLVEENNAKNSKKSSRTSSRPSLRGSRVSLDSSETGSDRGGSAVSKNSKHSCDSGLGDDYAHVITEDSDNRKIRAVESAFKEVELDLGITGTQCSRRLSAKDKERQSEQNVMAALREEGLISRPKTRAGGGISFEVVMEGPDEKAFARPPARLAKLERRKKKNKPLTEEEIRAKLQKAEERRKKKEQEKLERIESVTNKSDINQALDNFEKQQQSKGSNSVEKVEAVAEKRQKQLQEKRDKLRAKEEHAERVRRRKKLLPIVPHPESEVANEAAELKA